MASTSDSLPSSPSLPTTASIDAGADQEFTSDHHNLFLPCSSSPASLYFDSSFHGLLPTSSSSAAPSPPPPPAPPLPPHHPAPSKPTKKRPRASRRPPTTMLTTDTSNFRVMVQEFTGFPAPPFAAAPPPAVRPRLLGSPPFLMRPSPLSKYPHNSMLLPPSSCTYTTTLANTAINNTTPSSSNITPSTSSIMDALALFAKSNVMPPSSAGASATPPAGGSGAADHEYHGIGMGGFNPFDDFEAPDGERVNGDGGHHGFFSSFTARDKYGGGRH